MNILILFTQPWKTGGAETHVEALLKGLSQYNIFLAVNQGSNLDKLAYLKKTYTNVHITIIQARGFNLFKWHDSLQKLKDLIKRYDINIISAQQRTAGIWAWYLSRSTAIKYTVTMHDPWHRAKFKHLYPRIFPEIFTVSSNLANILYNEYGFKKDSVTIINNGIDFSLFKPLDKILARKRLSLSPDAKLIVHVSRLSSIKGAVSLALIDALTNLAQASIYYQLIIIGEGPLRERIEEKAHLFNSTYGNWITVKDFTPQIALWYNACDILIGEGRVAIEALACEKPVIAIRNNKSFLGLITKENIAYACAVNFDAQDQIANSANISREINNAFNLPADDSKNIALYLKNNLSIDKMTDAYLCIFKKLLHDKKNFIN
ncbi:glycosyltransferase [Pectinatus cerevisiiphilus]|uniref:Glycosyltransferase involved in cell wall biosynthesis n=1 Tax=Pectinatus cerevisiiphilus TaxID=86956 RepID=A0A4R3KCJ9_9FIRM|nr:glycosyltransferase [Pectinatus cerevisiiphilus]TCS80837.1 glycosyltransferase involved in cell wall biosynthesis [Pectinatus cerevisiiphilus]